jgi:hypothetical protein
MGSMKEALLKAGLKPTAVPKKENERNSIPKKKLTETIIHQEQRNYCEECQQVFPDVELYYHRNPTTNAEWICVKCADRLKISDEFRQTAQSDTSIRKMFKREHGHTRAANEFRAPTFKKPSGPVNGNR